MTERELTESDFARAIPAATRRRIIKGEIQPDKDIATLRKFLQVSQEKFAAALNIPVATLRNWEQGRRAPEGPAIALLQIAAQHPRIILGRIKDAA